MTKITLITLGHKMPEWVSQGSDMFVKRLQEHVQFKLIEIPLMKRGNLSDLSKILDKESELIQTHIPKQSFIVVLDKAGQQLSSEALATKIEQVQQHHAHLCFIIGGPEGLSQTIIQLAHFHWSFSKLTFPHTLARLILLEALYRSFSILKNHPYHK